jgi:hypothetical protein
VNKTAESVEGVSARVIRRTQFLCDVKKFAHERGRLNFNLPPGGLQSMAYYHFSTTSC